MPHRTATRPPSVRVVVCPCRFHNHTHYSERHVATRPTHHAIALRRPRITCAKKHHSHSTARVIIDVASAPPPRSVRCACVMGAPCGHSRSASRLRPQRSDVRSHRSVELAMSQTRTAHDADKSDNVSCQQNTHTHARSTSTESTLI